MTGKYSYNILSQLKPTFKVASISTGLMNNSQLKATLEWAISHPFSILMWFKQTEFQDFWDQSWRFLLSNIRAFNLYYHEIITDLAENYRTCPPFPKSAKLSTSTLNRSKISTWGDQEVDIITSLSLALRALRVTSAELAPDWPLGTGSFVFLVFEVLQQSAYLALFCWWELNSALGCQPPHTLSFEAQSWFEAQSSPLLFLISPIHRVIYC